MASARRVEAVRRAMDTPSRLTGAGEQIGIVAADRRDAGADWVEFEPRTKGETRLDDLDFVGGKVAHQLFRGVGRTGVVSRRVAARLQRCRSAESPREVADMA